MLRFKKEYEDVEIHIPHKRMIINKYNISDPEVQKVLVKFPKYAHNFEQVDSGVEEKSMLEEDDALVSSTNDDTSDLQPVSEPKPPVKGTSKKSNKKKK